jgi:hypothetical protein
MYFRLFSPNSNPSPPHPRGWPLSWVKQVVTFPEEKMLALRGIDATLYVRFLRGCCTCCTVLVGAYPSSPNRVVCTFAYLHHIPGLISHPCCLLRRGRGRPNLHEPSLNFLVNRHPKGQVPALGAPNCNPLGLGHLDDHTAMDMSWAYADADCRPPLCCRKPV